VADLAALTRPGAPPHALIYRPGTAPDRVDVLVGSVEYPPCLAALPLDGRTDVLAVVPYRQLAERGLSYPEDHTPLVALRAQQRYALPVGSVLASLPRVPVTLAHAGFDPDDAIYADRARRIVSEEISQGDGSNFVLSRSFTADVTDFGPAVAATLFARLIAQEPGAYWTFLVYTGGRFLVGASPERQVSVANGVATMNPISGTYRYPASGPTVPGLLGFLGSKKESDELFMVLDEELKMMAAICRRGGRVIGPRLKEMTQLAHTEYLISGETGLDVRDVLRHTLLAPSVTGSPLANACRVITRHEPQGRGYYAGVLALISPGEASDEAEGHTMDSAILIRTADISLAGRLRIGTGATIVRHSDPAAEAAETRAKAAGLLRVLGAERAATRARGRPGLAGHPEVAAALARRNDTLAAFWLTGNSGSRPRPGPLRPDRPLPARARADRDADVLVLDAEDAFTAMLAHQIEALGASVAVRAVDSDPASWPEHELTVLGPGPGDPTDHSDPRVAELHRIAVDLLSREAPTLAICLGHELLSGALGLPLHRLDQPRQGCQQQVDLFGTQVRVGFYNSFAAFSPADTVSSSMVSGPVRVSRDAGTAEVHAIHGPRLRSYQFHPESALSTDGYAILRRALAALLGRSRSERRAVR
jgi:phenazine biosynthesis protein phzE